MRTSVPRSLRERIIVTCLVGTWMGRRRRHRGRARIEAGQARATIRPSRTACGRWTRGASLAPTARPKTRCARRPPGAGGPSPSSSPGVQVFEWLGGFGSLRRHAAGSCGSPSVYCKMSTLQRFGPLNSLLNVERGHRSTLRQTLKETDAVDCAGRVRVSRHRVDQRPARYLLMALRTFPAWPMTAATLSSRRLAWRMRRASLEFSWMADFLPFCFWETCFWTFCKLLDGILDNASSVAALRSHEANGPKMLGVWRTDPRITVASPAGASRVAAAAAAHALHLDNNRRPFLASKDSFFSLLAPLCWLDLTA